MSKLPSPAEIAASPELFSRYFLKILNKEKVLVPFVWNRAQRHFHRARTGRDLILKARQLGFSTYVQGELFHRTVTSTRTTLTLAHTGDATSKLRLMADRFWDNCRFGDIQPARKFANASMTTYPELDSVAAIATAGALETGRGDTYTDMHGSEVAFWPDAQRIVVGAMQGGNPDVILESTANGAQGYFYHLCMDAMAGRNGWTLHFYPWWWDRAYQLPLASDEYLEPDEEERYLMAHHRLTLEQIKWRRSKQRELGSFFKQEFAEDPISCFLTSGIGYFGSLDGIFTAPDGASFDPTHHYGAGLDFAQTVDFTVCVVLDFTSKRQVDMLRMNKLEWDEQRIRIRDFCRKWRIESLLVEKNSIGSPNITELRKLGLNVIPFITTNESKASIVSELNEAVHHGGWRLLNDPIMKDEFNSFTSTQLPSGLWRLAAAGDGHDDTVLATALALRAGHSMVSGGEIERFAQNKIDTADLPPDLLEFMRASGVDIDAYLSIKQEML